MCGTQTLLYNQTPAGQVWLPHFTHGELWRQPNSPFILLPSQHNMMMGNCGVARPTAAHPNEAQPIAAQFFFLMETAVHQSLAARCHCPMNKCSKRHGKAIYTLHIVIPLPEGFASRSEKQISPNNILYQPTSISRFF